MNLNWIGLKSKMWNLETVMLWENQSDEDQSAVLVTDNLGEEDSFVGEDADAFFARWSLLVELTRASAKVPNNLGLCYVQLDTMGSYMGTLKNVVDRSEKGKIIAVLRSKDGATATIVDKDADLMLSIWGAAIHADLVMLSGMKQAAVEVAK